jgi:hypothetical protein
VKNAPYIVGIDLGTTNSVVAYTDAVTTDESEIKVFKIPQLTGAGVLEAREALPSFLYLLEGGEVSDASLALPWSDQNTITAGVFARERGAEVPHKLVSSSKSWLCNAQVDREAAVLPWESTGDVEKISPVRASSSILSHIRQAWNFEMAGNDDALLLENQEIYLTVPASFDAVARELTVEAAHMAGLTDIILIEEPQAAFYSWIDRSGDEWRDKVEKGDLVLVCDIGGGTSDFSLIEVQEGEEGALSLERLAVGEHLLVGGDNIDLALSYFLASKLQEKGKKLDAWQMRGLVHSCRKAKESLFTGDSPGEYPVTILGRGAGLIKGTIKSKLEHADVEKIVLDGFFPETGLDQPPVPTNVSGIREFGLSYEADPGITRHLAKFVSAHRDDQGQVRLPTAVVFNGGVMKSPAFRKRVMETLASWCEAEGQGTVREIDTGDFDLSVARGAAYYGRAAKGDGIRIRGGLGCSYYLAVEASMPAVPGIVLPTRALCIAPFGMEEGTGAVNEGRLFNLVVGDVVRFDIMTSTIRHQDMVGNIVDNWEQEDIRELSTIETILEGEANTVLPVTFEVRLTEIGTLEFWACSRDDERRWKLEFNVRPKSE